MASKNKLEKDEENAFCKMAFALGCKAIKFIDPSSRNAPDRIVLCPHGRVIFFEFKRLGEDPRPSQSKYHKGLRSLGFKVHVVYTAKEAMRILMEFMYAI